MTNSDAYFIEKDIPIPDDELDRKINGKQGRLPKYDFGNMQVSDSFKVCDTYDARLRKNVKDAAIRWALYNRLEWDFVVGKCPNDKNDLTKGFHLRIWRIK